MRIKDWFKRRRRIETQQPFTKERALRILQNYDGWVTTDDYEAVKIFIYNEMGPIDDQRAEKAMAMATITSDLFIDGHPELVIKERDNRKLQQLLILGALPKEVALASRKFVSRMRLTDIDQLVDHVFAISCLDKEGESTCTMTPSP